MPKYKYPEPVATGYIPGLGISPEEMSEEERKAWATKMSIRSAVAIGGVPKKLQSQSK